RGRPEAEILNQEPTGEPGQDTGVALWPPRQIDGWNADILGGYHQYQDQVCLIEELPSGALKSGQWRRMPILVPTTDGRARFLMLRKGTEERGAVPLDRPVDVPSSRTGVGLIALDFGTSNSLLLFSHAGDQSDEFVQHGVTSTSTSCRMVAPGSGFP